MALVKVSIVKLSKNESPKTQKRWVNPNEVSFIDFADVEEMKRLGWIFGQYDMLYRVVLNHNGEFFTDTDGLLRLSN